jgi:predicted NAD/FAD-binding protein
MEQRKIAIVGTGISGILSGYLLQQKYHVTLFEKNNRLGGHANTVLADNIPIDTGFIVYNTLNYPHFCQFIKKLGVASIESDMSFGYFNPSQHFWYASDFPWGVFSQKKHLLSPKFICFLKEIQRFNQRVLADLDTHIMRDISLNEYVLKCGFSSFFCEAYLYPMAAAIWSCPIETIHQYPAETFFSFWRNHRLLTIRNRPKWQTIRGGSTSYIAAFKSQFSGDILTSTPIQTIIRRENSVTLVDNSNRHHVFDAVVIATHADEALALLESPTHDETHLLSKWQYSYNHVTLHTDTKVMPPKRDAWASWLVKASPHSSALTMTYYMNRLQQLPSTTDYFTSLNLAEEIDTSRIIKSIPYRHPIYTASSVATQSKLHILNGIHNTYYCGSYFGNGFHEDGAKSAVALAKELGCQM